MRKASHLLFLRACAVSLGLAAATASRGAVEISDVQVTNVGTSVVTVIWTTSEVSTPGLQVFSDAAGTTSVSAGLAIDFYPFAEGDPAVVNDAAARAARRELEILAINRRVVVVRVGGLAPGTTYYLRPRTFDVSGVDNGTGPFPLRQVTTATFTSMVADARLLRVRFPGLAGAGMVAMIEAPGGLTPVAAVLGDGVPADSAVIPLAGFIDPATGTNATPVGATALSIRVIGVGAPTGAFTQSVDFGTAFRVAGLELAELSTTTPAPVFTSHPDNRSGAVGSTVTFSASATGTPDPVFLWQRLPAGSAVWTDLTNDGVYSGVGTSTLTVQGLTLAMSGDQFRCLATNGVLPNATSNPAILTVTPLAPVFVSTPPTPATAVQGLTFLWGPVTITGAPAVFSATGLPAGITVDSASGNLGGIPNVPGPLPSRFTVVLRAENSGGSTTTTIEIDVVPAPPQIASPAAASGQVGSDFSYTIVATNAPTAFGAAGLPAGLTLDSGSGIISGRPLEAGDFNVTVSATNAGGVTSATVVLAISPAPAAPVYLGITNPSGTQGAAFSFVPTYSGGPTSFAIVGGSLPSGLSLDGATGLIDGTPTEVGVFSVTLRATGAGGAVDSALQLTINPAPSAPVITSASAVATTVGASFSFTLTASGVPTVYTFGAENLPGWLSIDPASGVLSGTPVLGVFPVTVFASNDPGAGPSQRGPSSVLVITVSPSPSAPVLTSAAVVQGRVNESLSYQLTATPSASTYAVVSASPPSWLQLNASTGLVTGTPDAAGEARVTFAGVDSQFGQGNGLEVRFEIAPPLLAPVITSGGTAQGQAGQPFQYEILASNGPLTGYAIAGVLPAGLAFNPSTGVISGIPSAATLVPVEIMLSATNSSGMSDPKILEITILPPPATPVIMSPLEANGTVGESFNYQLQASESPTAYLASPLPGGLTVDSSTGAITGTPVLAGVYSVSVRASNTSGLGSASTLTITLVPRLTAPRIVSLPAAKGQAGESFSYAVEAEPGPIISYAISGRLPLGLSFNTATGALTGRPAESGLFLVQVRATNSAGTSLPQPLVLFIRPAMGVPLITSPGVALARVGNPFSYVITATNMPTARPFVPPNALEARNLPPGLSVNPAMGTIEGRPSVEGVFRVGLVGTNGSGSGAVREITLMVQPSPAAPRVMSLPTLAGQVGLPLRYQITAANSPTSFELRDGPPWMTVNSRTGEVSGTPTTPGNFVLEVLAINSSGRSDPLSVRVSIAPAPGTPVITSSRSAYGTLGTAFSFTLSSAPAATAFVVTGLPAGLTLNAATGVISGIPRASGKFAVNVRAINSAGHGEPVTLLLIVSSPVRLGGGS